MNAKPQLASFEPDMPDDVVVSVRHVSKKFCRDLRRSMAYGINDLARNMVGITSAADSLRKGEFWALDDVTFDLKRGEALGIIGFNGAGKTTLLRILMGVFPPDTGCVAIRGRVNGLVALGVGMHPYMTGRENIYLNGAILGMSREELDDKYESIVDFAEIGEFIDAPFSTYSSGMKVRLGFAVAITIKPEILVIDEVLSVGDQRFRRKARAAMINLLESNTGLIFISHNIHEVLGITQRTIWLDKGRVFREGSSAAVCTEYLFQSQQDREVAGVSPLDYTEKRTGDLSISDVLCHIGNKAFDRHVVVDTPENTLAIDITLTASSLVKEPIMHCISVATTDGIKVGYIVINEDINVSPGDRLKRRIVLETDQLQPGSYHVGYEIGTEGGPPLEGVRNLVRVEIRPRTWLMTTGHGESVNYARMAGNLRGAVLLRASLHR